MAKQNSKKKVDNMAKWSRELILDNISYIINKNGLAIKEAEIASGVSVGYIARMKKGQKKFLQNLLCVLPITLM